jgi:hypothetical protein
LIARESIPEHALHAHYARRGAYLDCYATDFDRAVTLAEFITAFYTTWLFKLERWILSWSVNKPSTDEQARELAQGRRTDFAAWTLEARGTHQLLMCDFLGATRSWFMVEATATGARLYFGSVVTSRSAGFRGLLGFHKLYSRALLAAARPRLRSLFRQR